MADSEYTDLSPLSPHSMGILTKSMAQSGGRRKRKSRGSKKVNLEKVFKKGSRKGSMKKRSTKRSVKKSRKGSKGSKKGSKKSVQKKRSTRRSKKGSKKTSSKRKGSKRSAKKRSAKRSKKSSKKSGSKKRSRRSASRGANPKLLRYVGFVKHITSTMGIKGGPVATIIAKVYKEQAEKAKPGADFMTIIDEAQKIFDNDSSSNRQKHYEAAQKHMEGKRGRKKKSDTESSE